MKVETRLKAGQETSTVAVVALQSNAASITQSNSLSPTTASGAGATAVGNAATIAQLNNISVSSSV